MKHNENDATTGASLMDRHDEEVMHDLTPEVS